MNDETCSEKFWRGGTWDGSYVVCGKPAKGHLPTGEPVCGIHLRSVNLAEARSDALAEWTRRKHAIGEALGFAVWGAEVGGPLQVRMEDLENLAARVPLPLNPPKKD